MGSNRLSDPINSMSAPSKLGGDQAQTYRHTCKNETALEGRRRANHLDLVEAIRCSSSEIGLGGIDG